MITMRYRINGVNFLQRELNFKEYERCKKIMLDKVDAFKLPDEQYKKIIDELYDRGILKELFQVILKLDEPNVLARIINRIRVRLSGTDLENIIGTMQGSAIARVVTDFFLCNKAWTTNLLFLSESLNSYTRTTIVERLRTRLTRRSTTSPEKTSYEPATS
jgi:hypothetical protein